MIMPKKLQHEERELLNRYMEDESIPEIGAYEYAKTNGSKELQTFYEARDREAQEAAKEGWIIN